MLNNLEHGTRPVLWNTVIHFGSILLKKTTGVDRTGRSGNKETDPRMNLTAKWKFCAMRMHTGPANVQ